MPKGVVKTKADEKKWNKAKSIVREQYKDKSEDSDSFWALTNSIFQNMKGKKKASGWYNMYIESSIDVESKIKPSGHLDTQIFPKKVDPQHDPRNVTGKGKFQPMFKNKKNKKK
ncbi:MAG: hypothetical protein AABY32_02660 [Nanoarchaeota archaeon]